MKNVKIFKTPLLNNISTMIYRLILHQHTISQTMNTIRYATSGKSTYLKYAPIALTIYPTDRCTLTCNMCVNHSPHRPKNAPYLHEACEDMTLNKFKSIVDRFKSAIFLDLIGSGEPFLNNDIFNMIDYGAKVRKMYVGTVSNGTILNDKINQIIHSPLHAISISLNGYNSHEYYKMSGGSKQVFNTVLMNISELVEERNKNRRDLEINMSCICTKKNYKYIPNMVELADELGADVLDFHNLIPSEIMGFTKEQCLYENDEDVIEVISNVDAPKSRLIVNMPKLLQLKPHRLCKWYFEGIRVDSKGNVGSCGKVIAANKVYGNYMEKGVWNNNHFRKMRQMFLDESNPLLDCCKTCTCNSNYKPVVLYGCKHE